jgi:RNA polymerase sigma-70 factor (ECF subfamily)
MSSGNDREIFKLVKQGDKSAYETLFRENYSPMVAYAFRFFGDIEPSESVVQDVFLKLWHKRGEFDITTSLKNYLFRSVRNLCINRLEHEKIISSYQKYVIQKDTGRNSFGEFYIEVGLKEKIETAIKALPEKRQKIFRMAREDGLKYKEIAEELNISIKTVEAQMGLALKQLRETLKEYKSYVNG